MDKIDELIKTLNDFKEELNKNVNMSYGQESNASSMAEPNMAKEELEKDAANPALAPKEVKVKQLKAQIDAGTYKPDPKKIADKMLKEDTSPNMLACSENGQWYLKDK